MQLTKQEELIVEYFSKKLIAYKRIYEMEMLSMLISRKNRLSRYQELLQEKYNVTMDEQVERSVVRNLRNEFPKEEERKKYSDCILYREKCRWKLFPFHTISAGTLVVIPDLFLQKAMDKKADIAGHKVGSDKVISFGIIFYVTSCHLYFILII